VLLVTWNVNSLKVRLPRVLELLAEHRPGVVCLQETKVTPEAFPHDELLEAGYQAVEHSGGRWAGVAILAREDLELGEASPGLPGEPHAEDARWIEAVVEGVRVVSVYVPNGREVGSESFSAKLAFLDAAAARLAEPRGEAAIVGGDFNIAPADEDVYDPAAFVGSTHVTPQERARLQTVLASGLVDAYRVRHPSEVGFTWWDYRQGHFHRKLGMRIDLVLVSEELSERVAECGINRNYRKGPKPSDHAPLLLELSG